MQNGRGSGGTRDGVGEGGAGGGRVFPREPQSEAGALGSTPAVQPRVWWDPRHPEPPQPSCSPGPHRRAGRGRGLGPKARTGRGAGLRALPSPGGWIRKRAAAAAHFLQLITSVGVSGGAGECECARRRRQEGARTKFVPAGARRAGSPGSQSGGWAARGRRGPGRRAALAAAAAVARRCAPPSPSRRAR